MKIKVFIVNENGKIEFTPDQLECLLNKTHADGYTSGYAEGEKARSVLSYNPDDVKLTPTVPYCDNKTMPYTVPCDAILPAVTNICVNNSKRECDCHEDTTTAATATTQIDYNGAEKCLNNFVAALLKELNF